MRVNDKYEPLFKPKTRVTILTGGRASGKSYVAPLAILNQVLEDNKVTCLFSRFTMIAASDSIIPEFNSRISELNQEGYFRSAHNNIYCTNGNKILFRGLKTSSGNQTAKLKSIEGLNIFVLDEAEEWDTEEDYDIIEGSIREKDTINWILIIMNPSHINHWIYRRFFKPNNIPQEFTGIKNGIQFIHTTYLDNLDNLSDDYLKMIEETKQSNIQKYNHLYRGHWIDENQNALWRMKWIDSQRVYNKPHTMKRIVVSVDPAISKNINSDETGIVTVGIDPYGKGYVLSDKSGIYSPQEWAKKAVDEYNRWEADAIVAEKNQGGDMVKFTLQSIQANVPVRLVHASKGKILRAEPVSSLYEEGKVSHVGHFPECEDEMVTYTGEPGEKSPNRLDALVHGLTEVMLTRKEARRLT